jgi:hypothetical protein
MQEAQDTHAHRKGIPTRAPGQQMGDVGGHVAVGLGRASKGSRCAPSRLTPLG